MAISRHNVDVAFFIPNLEPGGVERAMVNLANGLSDVGKRVDFVVLQPTGQFVEDLDPRITFASLNSRRALTSIIPLVRYLRDRRPSILLSSKTHINVVASAANLLAGNPARHVACEHSHYQMSTAVSIRDRVALRLAATTYRHCDAVVTVSRDVARAVCELANLDTRQVAVIPNPVVTPALRAAADRPPCDCFTASDRLHMIAVGRFDRVKRFDLLLEATALLRRDMPVHLTLVGAGEERPRLQAQLERCGLENNVSLPGLLRDPLPRLREANVLVLSSDFEAFPTVLVEALFCGMNIVATDCCSAIRDILDGGRLGTIVQPGDARELAAGIQIEAQIKRSRGASREWAERYSRERAVASYLTVFTDLWPPVKAAGPRIGVSP